MKNGKRILSVTVKRMIDTDPDTSYLGEYGNRAESEYAIDRAHEEDCASLEHNHNKTVSELEHIIAHLNNYRDRATPESEDWNVFDESIDTLIELQDSAMECNCGFSGEWNRREYRYFNPPYENYEGIPKDEIRKYCKQDYERMESYNNQNWCYLGIRAEARIQLTGDLTQTISSGGLWGIESDSDESYFEETEQEELSQLRAELKALGFSTRAIAAAFKNVQHKEG